MTSERVVQWVIAELRAAAGVRAILTGSPMPVGPQDADAFPSAEGLWVSVEAESATERYADEVVLRVYVVRKGRRTDCAALAFAAREALTLYAGTPKTWNVAPLTKMLRIKSVSFIPSVPAGKDGEPEKNFFTAVLRFRVRGKSALLTP